MQKFALLAFMLTGLAVAAHGQNVNVGPGAVKLGVVRPDVVKSPEYPITSGPVKRSKIGDWIECEVEYETKADLIDELTFSYTILIGGKLLSGEVTYVNILKDRSHFAVMYVSPKALMRLSGGRPVTPAAIENVWVVASRQGQVLDKKSAKPGPIPNLQQMTGMVLNKDQTPFAPLFYDRYEEIRQGR